VTRPMTATPEQWRRAGILPAAALATLLVAVAL
jgi:cobalt/nickel transport system permease protein